MTGKTRPYGTWPSPVSAEAVAGKSLRFGTLQCDGGAVFWSESRPDEGGRGVIVRAEPGGRAVDLLTPPHSARSKVHEYGGGEFLAADGRIFFVDADTQDIHEIVPGAPPMRVTDAPDTRFADMALDPARNRLIAVVEREGDDPHAPENFLASISLEPGTVGNVGVLARGRDFYSSPRLSPDAQTLAWLAWDLPHMPWETAALHVARVGEDGLLEQQQRIAGGEGDAVFQPGWSSDGRLYFVWDRSGWGALHAWDGTDVREISARQAELMRPHWVFAMQSWCFLDEKRIAAAFIERGETRLFMVDVESGVHTRLETPLRSIDALAPFGSGLALIGAGDTAPPAVIALAKDGNTSTLQSAGVSELSETDISIGEVMSFEGEAGEIYALYYPPANAAWNAPEGELPPVIIMVHGGPTGMADRGLKLKIQYWTSRGFAVADIDYSGSAGYGREYRKRLDGQWGVLDVADVAALVRHLAGSRRADPERLLISGGSAGGYTVLMALAMLDCFAAGACSYGVSDLSRLQRITHKFESGYLYGLTGTTARACEPLFEERSPVNLADGIDCPVIFFQGLEDRVVPPSQTRKMVDTLRKRGVSVASREFADEGHGFRRAETIVEVLESEYAFYARVLGLDPAEKLPELEIENFER